VVENSNVVPTIGVCSRLRDVATPSRQKVKIMVNKVVDMLNRLQNLNWSSAIVEFLKGEQSLFNFLDTCANLANDVIFSTGVNESEISD
jgi:hypothetical protein